MNHDYPAIRVQVLSHWAKRQSYFKKKKSRVEDEKDGLVRNLNAQVRSMGRLGARCGSNGTSP